MASRIKSARVESPRATGLSSVAFASGSMETHVLTGERNISLRPHKQQDGKILTSEIYQQNLTPS
ncbi:hypothetical protein HMPREF0864_04822 [Enterobacteriaceae bacterium 9_2_54FAA]|nr:hypothetical protein HMPREF0864_04822 [Enterobacteriaceae bacterium 9_2_54FAA]